MSKDQKAQNTDSKKVKTEKPATLTGPLQLFSKSWEVVKKNIRLYIYLYAFSIVTTVFGLFYTEKNGASNELSMDIPGQALGITAFILISIVLSLLQTILWLRSAQGHNPSFSEIWQEFQEKGLKLLLLTIVLGIVIVAGLLALVIPGILFISWYIMSPYIMLDKNVGVFDAMKMSKELSKGKFSAIWGVILVTVLLSLPGIIPVIGTLIALFLTLAYSAALALRYEELKKLS